ncbi:CPCC family cysteine-rich protein [Variovorax sp. DT-64]|uniref:CPCC family cysteine-rich protein n=1 Tax=Variovorax sp. DT-64 TaxID=3396160 RepID=UPI003F1B14C1
MTNRCHGQGEQGAAVVRGGPNGTMSLAEGRASFRAFGASDKSALLHVRRPYAHELP